VTTARAVITGLGVVAPGAIGIASFWNLLTSGRTATRVTSLFDASAFRSRVAAECDFDPVSHGLVEKLITRTDRSTQFAIVAAREAVVNAGIDMSGLEPHRVGVSFGSAVGAVAAIDAAYRLLSESGRAELEERVAGDLFDRRSPSVIAREVAWQVGAEGPVAMISAGCTSGLDAVGHALALIREGSADVVIAGATDAPITPITAACFDAIRATSADNDDPEHAARPFDRTRRGFVLGEGAAAVVVESLDHARARGADVIAEIAGFGSRCNAHHMTGLREDGVELSRAIDEALQQARLNRDDLQYINAHGSGTLQNDRHETAAYKRSLGHHAYDTPVSSIKSMVGHSLGAIGTIELTACALAIRHGVIPPTANLRQADHPSCDLDYVPLVARERRVDAVLSVGSGFGGFQSAAVLKRVA
jgi:minimal PKS ketosynthase (KS/KS alpha)